MVAKGVKTIQQVGEVVVLECDVLAITGCALIVECDSQHNIPLLVGEPLESK